MTRVAVLGMGTMGASIAQRLTELGHDVRVWNRTPARTVPLAALGIKVCDSPAAAARDVTVVLVVVADELALDQVMTGPDGVYAVIGAGHTVVVMSTVSASAVRRLAETVRGRAAVALDAGMLGNGKHAGSGALRVYLGGDAAAVESVRSLLADLAKEITHVGPLGAGMDHKLVLNLLMGLEMQALAEAVSLGARLGLDRVSLFESIGASGFSSPVMTFKARRMAARRYGEPDFRLTLMTKDLGLAVAASHTVGLTLPMTCGAHETHRTAVEAGHGDEDCAAIAEAFPS